MHILAVIPARGGSKGILNKNIRMFGGKPLIFHAIDQAKQSKFISRVIVSTESDKIASVAKRYGAEVPFLRPAEFAQDKSKVTDAVVHLITRLQKEEKYNPDYIVLLQPTSPLRLVEDIDGAIELLLRRHAGTVVSICRTEQLLFTKDSKDCLHLESNKDFLGSSNRQQLPPTYKLDGSMVYVVKTKSFLKYKSFLAGKIVGYEIPRWRAVDLDEPQDFVAGELIFKNYQKISKDIENFK